MNDDPFTQFETWFAQAQESQHGFAEAMALATATPAGVPSVRMVLLRGWDRRGFCFFTNYGSRKGAELKQNPQAALVFYWSELGRQVRISGIVARLPAEESDVYFRSRPWGSQVGAWISKQSEPIPPSTDLETLFEAFESQAQGKEIERPSFWGGFRLAPQAFEFWSNRPNRLHDRFQYTRNGESSWRIEKLFP